MLLTQQQGAPLPNGVVAPSYQPYAPQSDCDGPHETDLVVGDLGPDLTNGMLQTAPLTLQQGLFQRRTVLGQVYASNPSIVARNSNTGNGTVTNILLGPNPYELTATAVSPTAFSVFAGPTGGAPLGIGGAMVGARFSFGQQAFTIQTGSIPFAIGDQFVVVPGLSVGTYIPCVKTATDGSQIPLAVLADDVGPPTGGMTCRAYVSGTFNASALIIDPSWALADMVAALAATSIYCK